MGKSEKGTLSMRRQALIDTYLDQVLTGPRGRKIPRACHVFGTAKPGGASDWHALHDRQHAMMARLRELEVYAEAGYAIGPLRSFVEPIVIASLMLHEAAADFAREMRIGMYVERHDDTLYVLDRHGEIVTAGPVVLPEETGVCVMPNCEPSSVCFMQGGPFGSRAIAASLEWVRERQRLIAALGCKTCDQGRYYRVKGLGDPSQAQSQGGPIALGPHQVTTRFTAMLEVTRG